MAKILKIITNPNPILRKISKPLRAGEIKSELIKKLIPDMAKTMVEKDGVGLAAPQVGRNIRLIVVNSDKTPLAMINPEITRRSWAKKWDEEGCLSVPNTFGKVQRHKKIHCLFLDASGTKRKIQVEDLMARVIQHEIDHLDGILFIDKARDIKTITP